MKRFQNPLELNFMQRKKSKILYIDTNVILDFVVDKDNYTVVLMESVKTRDWKLRISTFAMIELAEYRKNEIFLWDKLSQNKSLNSIIKRIKNPRENKKLKRYHFEQVSSWLENLQQQLPNIGFLDLDSSKDENIQSSWQLAHELGIYSNLNAKDVIHLATAIAASQNKECDFFITNDGDLYNESNKIIKEIKLENKLKVLKPKEFVEQFPPIKKK